jgi:hypothetical protein
LDHLSTVLHPFPTVLHPFQLFRASHSKGSFKKTFQQPVFDANFSKNSRFLGLGSGMGFNARDLMGLSHPAGRNSEQLFHL